MLGLFSSQREQTPSGCRGRAPATGKTQGGQDDRKSKDILRGRNRHKNEKSHLHQDHRIHHRHQHADDARPADGPGQQRPGTEPANHRVPGHQRIGRRARPEPVPGERGPHRPAQPGIQPERLGPVPDRRHHRRGRRAGLQRRQRHPVLQPGHHRADHLGDRPERHRRRAYREVRG